MMPFGKNILPFFGLFSITIIIMVGSMYNGFPAINLLFFNLIFLSLLFQQRRVTLLTGLGMALIYSFLWFTPYIQTSLENKILVYFGTLFLFAICTWISLYILDISNRTNQSLKHFFLLYENATEAIIIADEMGKIVLANPTACRIFGYSEDELLKKPIDMLVPASKRESHPHKRMSYVKSPSNREMGKGRDLSALRRDGSEFPVEISLSSYKDRKRTYVIAFIIDITVRKNSEQIILQNNLSLEKLSKELSSLNEDLEKKVESRTKDLTLAMENLEKSQSELKEALNKEKELSEIKSRFVSMASHEFRTPLSTVLSSSSLLERYTLEKDQPKREKHIYRIKESVRHLNALLEDFLSLGKLEENKISIQKSPENIANLLSQIIEEVEANKKEGQKINFNYNARPMGLTDKNLLRSIGINLLTNAIKFSGEDGLIKIDCSDENGLLKVVVTDNGIGIPEEDMPNLFSTFFRSKNVTNIQGTGLGLHIIKRYIDLLDGNISIVSVLGKGTTVTVNLPY